MTIDTAASVWGEFSAMHAWAIATAAVVAAGCALVGTLLVVRRMSLLGDAISHAVLPGIAVAVLAGGRPGGVLVLVGAVAAALVTVLLVQALRREGGLAADAGTGVVFTTLFALGVVIITAAASRIDLDPGCILYGILELVPFDTVRVAGLEVPRAFLTGAGVLAVVAVGLAVTWKEQLFTAFDSDAARAVGLPVAAVTGGLLAATALVTVASFGYLAAWRFDTSAAGMMAVVLGLEYVVAAIVAPEDGVVARLAARLALGWRVTCEDTLALIWRADEARAGAASQPFRSPGEWAAGLWLAVSGRIVRDAGRWGLTAIGRAEAETVVRSHRLWEAWLGRHADLPLDHLHPPAEWIEHHLGADLRRRIEADVGAEESDPHGRSIPREP
jgi:manganese/zinc/iron transport system permease protein